jgi:hypothetical protein
MTSAASRTILVGTLVAVALVVSTRVAAVEQELTRTEAENMARKLEAIETRGITPAKAPAKPVSTSFTEREVNSFFKFMGPMFMPTGISNTQLGFGADGNVNGRAIVDLNAIRTAEARGWLDPLAYVAGSMEVQVAGRLLASNGKGVFQFQSASIGGVPVAKSVVQELLAFYTKSPEYPKGLNLDDPFELPSNIRSVQTKVGTATVVQ